MLNIKDPEQAVKNLGSSIIYDKEYQFNLELAKADGQLDFCLGVRDPFELVKPIPEMIKPKQMIYASLYPDVPEEYNALNTAISKLLLEDPAVSVTKESSPALGNGFRCGFLGTLHMECFKQRIEDEFDLGCITTYPTVLYKVQGKN